MAKQQAIIGVSQKKAQEDTMYVIKARTGNYLLDVKNVPTWTPHIELSLKAKTREAAEAIKQDLQSFWGIQVAVLPVFEPNRFEPARDYRKVAKPNPKLSPFSNSSSTSHFEYTL